MFDPVGYTGSPPGKTQAMRLQEELQARQLECDAGPPGVASLKGMNKFKIPLGNHMIHASYSIADLGGKHVVG